MSWFWCQRHDRAEHDEDACHAIERLGPYPTREAAQRWQETVDARNDEWDQQERQWDGGRATEGE